MITTLQYPRFGVWEELCTLAKLPLLLVHSPGFQQMKVLFTQCAYRSIYPAYEDDHHPYCSSCARVIPIDNPLDQSPENYLDH
jgi:hypothetical protein